MQKIYKGVM